MLSSQSGAVVITYTAYSFTLTISNPNRTIHGGVLEILSRNKIIFDESLLKDD